MAQEKYTIKLADPSSEPDIQNGEVLFVGTATVIFRYGGFCFMTDPNFLHKGDHAHLGPGVEAIRLTDPAIELGDIPKDVDFIVLSHFHEDHFDKIFMEKGPVNIPIVTTPHGVENIKKLDRFKETTLYELSTWDKITFTKGSSSVSITATPGKHAPTGLGFLLPPVMGSLIDFGSASALAPKFRLWISGDTLLYDDLKEIPKRFPNISLALVHLGGTTILKVFVVTMDGAQGVECLKIIKPKVAIPVHYNDYDLFKSPLSEFQDLAAKDKELTDVTELVYLKHGDMYRFSVSKTSPAGEAQ